MRVRYILFLVLSFYFVNLVISYFATKTISYSGHFSFPDLLISFNLPDFVKRFAGFDGLHYINISINGYEKNEVAFFPLYPLLIRLASIVFFVEPSIAALAISCTTFGASLLIFPKYLRLIGSGKNIKWFLVFLLTYPTSFFLLSAYTESLFIFLILLTLYFNKKQNTLVTFLFGFLAGATRVVGVFLAIPLLFSKRRSTAFLSPVLGFLSYAGYLWLSTGDPLKFFHVQSQFGAGRQGNLILLPQVMYRYLKIFFTAELNYLYFIAVVEFVLFMFVLSILLYDLYRIMKKKTIIARSDRLGLNLYGLVMLILPTLTGTLLSIPRFIIPIFPIYLVLSEIKNLPLKLAFIGLFSFLHIVLLMAFIQGYFVS